MQTLTDYISEIGESISLKFELLLYKLGQNTLSIKNRLQILALNDIL